MCVTQCPRDPFFGGQRGVRARLMQLVPCVPYLLRVGCVDGADRYAAPSYFSTAGCLSTQRGAEGINGRADQAAAFEETLGRRQKSKGGVDRRDRLTQRAREFLRHSVVDTYQTAVVLSPSPRRGYASRLHFEPRGCCYCCCLQLVLPVDRRYMLHYHSGQIRTAMGCYFHDVTRPRMTGPRTMAARIGHQARNASGIRQ